MGTLSFADDINISCPSLYGLNSMLYICNNFAHDNFISRNKNMYVSLLLVLPKNSLVFFSATFFSKEYLVF